jgi:hypothetical protein
VIARCCFASDRPEVFESYRAQREAIIEALITQDKDNEYKVRMQGELEELLALDALSCAIRVHRRHIIREIFELRCPNCGQVFVDFTGCFALTCSRPTCQTGFCGWCLENCGDSEQTHKHVIECKEKERGAHGYFGKEELFVQCHQKRRCKQLRAYLLSIADEDVRSGVMSAIADEAADLNIDVMKL